MLFPAGSRLLNMQRALHAMRKGVQWVLRVDCDLQLKSIPLWRWMLRRLSIMAAHHVAALLPVTARRLLAYKEHRLEKRLSPLMQGRSATAVDEDPVSRIVLVNNSLAAGGAERQLVNTARKLAEEGQDVSILCCQLGTDEYDFHGPGLGPGIPVSGLNSLISIMASAMPEQARHLQGKMHDASFERLAGLLLFHGRHLPLALEIRQGGIY